MARRRVHRPRQVDGRVGDAPPPRGGRRLVHHPPRRGRASCAASTSRPLTSRATTRKRARSTSRTCRRTSGSRRTVPTTRAWIEILPRTPLTGDAHNLFAVDAADRRDARPIADLPRWRRGPAACLRRRRARLGPPAAPRRGRPGRRRARRDGRRLQRHVFRLTAQPDHARRRAQHGRRLGDQAAARPGTRLDDRSPRRTGDDQPR